jgi:mannose-6-phosphate isomerase-like protein (cupin superfamily)
MMLVSNLDSHPAFVAGDGTHLREILHPDQSDAEIPYSIAHASVKPGEASQPHTLRGSEVYYILSGIGGMYVGDEQAEVSANSVIYVPPGALQYIQNTGSEDLVFLCIVQPAWRAEDEEIL